MRRILSPSFPLPLTYVCCFSCSYCCFSCSIPKTTAVSLHQTRSSWRLRRHWPVCVYILLLSIPLLPLPSMFGHFSHPNFKRPIPAQKWILKQQVPLNALKAQHENHLPMYEPLPSPRQSHSQNNTKNPSRATAAMVGRVHRGPSRDQLLDHGGMASPSRVMQRRQALGAEDATPTAGLLQLPSRNKAYSHGMFLRVVGQNVDRLW